MKNKYVIYFYLLVLLFANLVSNCLLAQTWMPLKGPDYSYCPVITLCPNGDLYAGTNIGRIFKSTDNGDSWTDITHNFPNFEIISIAAKPTGEIFLGCYQKMYISRDGGKNWELALDSLNFKSVYCFAFLSGDTVLAGTNEGIMETTDNGKNWFKPDSCDFSSSYVLSLAQSNDTVYAGTSWLGIYMSVNRGRSWVRNKSFPNANPITSIQLAPNGYIMLLNSAGIYLSTDKGISWKDVGKTFITTDIKKLFIHRDGNAWVSNVSEGVFVSKDYGYHWSYAGDSIPQGLITTEFCTDKFSNILVSTGTGIYKSTNKGVSWFSSSKGINCITVQSMIINEKNEILAGTNTYGFIKSTDDGKTWILPDKNINVQGIYDINSILYKPGGSIFAGTKGLGFFSSTDDGMSWYKKNNGITVDYPEIMSMGIDSSGNIYAGGLGLFKTTDNGNNWFPVSDTLLDNTNIFDINIDAKGNIFLLTIKNVVISTDDGKSWSIINTGYTFTAPTKILTVGNEIFFSTWNAKFFYSSDYGVSWEQRQGSLPVNSLINSFVLLKDSVLFVSTVSSGVFYSTDKGKNFNEFNAGLPTKNLKLITVGNSGKLYVSTTNYGIYELDETVNVQSDELPPSHLSEGYLTSEGIFCCYLQVSGNIHLSLYNLLGTEVKVIKDGFEEAGVHDYELKSDVKQLNNGFYILRLETNKEIVNFKIILTR